MSALALLSFPIGVATAHDSACARFIQGNVAWNDSGDTRWVHENLDRLCSGAEDTTEPARCFDMVMHTGVDHGRGTRWAWRDAVDLCAGTRDHHATVACFRRQIAAGVESSGARAACRWDAGSSVANMPRPSLDLLENFVRPTTWRPSRTSFSEATGVVRSAPSLALGRVAGLRRFQLLFHESDHKIRHLAVLVDDRFAEFAFNDNDGEDLYWGGAEWAVLSNGTAGQVESVAAGRVDLAIEPGPPGSKLVLSGFEFRRADDSDANVRMVGIRLEPEELRVRVWLIDDQGADFRSLGETLGWSALGGLFLPPVGNVIAGAASAPPASPGGMRPYRVKVQYAWIPADTVVLEGSTSGSRAYNADRWEPEGPVVLQGFEFAFGNSDHHLGAFAVTLGAEYNVLYRDDGWDDPINWAVSYAVLRSDRRR